MKRILQSFGSALYLLYSKHSMEMEHSRMIKTLFRLLKENPVCRKKLSVHPLGHSCSVPIWKAKLSVFFFPYPTPLRKRGLCYATWHDAPHMPYCTPQGSLPDILSFLELPHPLSYFFFFERIQSVTASELRVIFTIFALLFCAPFFILFLFRRWTATFVNQKIRRSSRNQILSPI